MSTDVLVVDDDAITRQMVAHVLEAADYRVTVANDGEQALNILRKGNCQLVVSDWSMPVMNGLELCSTIRTSDLRHYVYFILLTGHHSTQDTISGLAAGADDYVKKPFEPGELVMRVNTGRRIIAAESSGMTIFALAKLAESRDPETGEHLERVRNYCHALAKRLQSMNVFADQLSDDFVRLIYETSPLHDIGKVAIPDAILLKPGRLSVEEFDIMKTHTTHGANTLAAARTQFPNARFLQMAHDIAISHHERFDGSGYPLGLSGRDIPLCGRIVALADVYDALTSKRVYKDAMSHEEAKTLIMKERGKHFDPVLTDAFLAMEQQFIAIRSRYEEASTQGTSSISAA